MGRQNGADPTVLHSSIALLQERFRQLQRVKEMREERELLRVFSHSDAGQPARLEPFFHPDLILPSRPLQGSSPRQPLHLLQREDRREMVKLTRLWPEKTTAHHVFRSSDIDKPQDVADVDTSLHL